MKRIKLTAALIALVCAPTVAVAASIIDGESTAPEDVAEAIEALVLEWGHHWSNSDWAKIYRMWDPNEEAPYYLGEERQRWLIGREGLESYFNPPEIMRTIMGGVIMTPYRLRVRLVADDVAIVIWENKLQMDIRGRRQSAITSAPMPLCARRPGAGSSFTMRKHQWRHWRTWSTSIARPCHRTTRTSSSRWMRPTDQAGQRD